MPIQKSNFLASFTDSGEAAKQEKLVPLHWELYIILEEYPEILEEELGLQIESISYEFCHQCFEGLWDIKIETLNEVYLIEYKTGFKESNTEELLRQVNNRRKLNENTDQIGWYKKEDYNVVALSFDDFYERSREVLNSNEIELVVLDSSELNIRDIMSNLGLLEKENPDYDTTIFSGVESE